MLIIRCQCGSGVGVSGRRWGIAPFAAIGDDFREVICGFTRPRLARMGAEGSVCLVISWL